MLEVAQKLFGMETKEKIQQKLPGLSGNLNSDEQIAIQHLNRTAKILKLSK